MSGYTLKNGLKNAPANFQRYMKHCLEEIAIPYMDNVIVFNKLFEEHVELVHVQKVLCRLWQRGIKLNQASINCFKEAC